MRVPLLIGSLALSGCATLSHQKVCAHRVEVSQKNWEQEFPEDIRRDMQKQCVGELDARAKRAREQGETEAFEKGLRCVMDAKTTAEVADCEDR